MAFPEDALERHFDMFLGGAWVSMDDRFEDQDVAYTWGRADERSEADPMSLGVRLLNRDGWLTPDDPRSPWWPELALNVPMRMKIGSTLIAQGEVSSIKPTWPLGDLSKVATADLLDLDTINANTLGESYVDITMSGITRRLSQGQNPLRSAIHRLATSVDYLNYLSDYWTQEDGAGATFMASGFPLERGSDDAPMTFRGFDLASDVALAGSAPLPTVRAGGDAEWSAVCSGISGGSGGWVLDLFMHIPQPLDDVATTITLEVEADSPDHAVWQILIGWNGTHAYVRLQSHAPDGTLIVNNTLTAPTRLIGGFIQMRLNVDDNGSGIDWGIAWAQVTPDEDETEGFGGTAAGATGRPTRVSCQVTSAPAGGFSTGHVVLRSSAVDGGWLIPADIGWQGERALARLRRLCAEESIPLTYRSSPEGTTTELAEAETAPLGIQRPTGLLDLLREAAEADGGILADRIDFLALFYATRRSRYCRDVAMTLDASLSHIANPFAPTTDDQPIRNDITVKRDQGIEVRLVDAASSADPPTGDGLYPDTKTLSLFEDGQVRDQAGWLLHLGTSGSMTRDLPSGARARYAQITIDFASIAAPAALIVAWFARRIGHRIQVINLPPQHPIEGPVDLIIEGATHAIGSKNLVVTINCSPAGPWQVARWDVDRWTPKDNVLGGDIDATQTVFDVFVPGIPWTTNPANFPLDIRVGKVERMTVTSIAPLAGGETQEFTVIRNVNRFGRAHDSGAPVTLYPPAVLCL